MNKGFWTNNSCCPSWSDTASSWWSSAPPRLLQTSPPLQEAVPVVGCQLLRLTDASDALAALSQFWERYFSVSKVCRCVVPASHIQAQLVLRKWEVWIVVRQDRGEIVGSIVRRWFDGLRIYEASWPKGAMIDFYCVHPAWRGRGIGRWLLATVHNTCPRPFPPHLILWEQLRPSVPPLQAGFFWMRRCLGMVSGQQAARQLRGEEASAAWMRCVRGVAIVAGSAQEAARSAAETQIWMPAGAAAAAPVLLYNTLHRSVPDGIPISFIMSGKPYDVAQLIITFPTPHIFLLPHTNPFTLPIEYGQGWTYDSSFQWIAYNVCAQPGQGFPCLAL